MRLNTENTQSLSFFFWNVLTHTFNIIVNVNWNFYFVCFLNPYWNNKSKKMFKLMKFSESEHYNEGAKDNFREIFSCMCTVGFSKQFPFL